MTELALRVHRRTGAEAAAGRRTATAFSACVVALLVALLGCPRASGDAGVILNESLDTSVARITGSGHTAVYLSRVCPESPVKLRLCRPGELGSVISNYTTLGEDQPFEWNVVPLSIFLYGVEDPQNRPIFGSQKIKKVLEDNYREKYLAGYCASASCQTSNNAEWREMVAATISRSLYIFVVDTTVEQDEALIAQLNAAPNVNHFNGVTRNCATFSRRVINSYYPHAASADYLNDLGMTSPKAIARSFTHFARKHPEAHFRVYHFAQLPGTLKRSTEARAGTEQLFRSKKLLVPMLIFAQYELPAVAGTYLLTGRFNPNHEMDQNPSVEVTEAMERGSDAVAEVDAENEDAPSEDLRAERDRIVGTSDVWKKYREDFDWIVDESVREEAIRDRGSLGRTFRRLDAAGVPLMDRRGAAWMDVTEEGRIVRIGVSASNILAPGSDPDIAFEVTLARADHYLKSPQHSRETLVEFKQDWDVLLSARANRMAHEEGSGTVLASAAAAAPGLHGAD